MVNEETWPGLMDSSFTFYSTAARTDWGLNYRPKVPSGCIHSPRRAAACWGRDRVAVDKSPPQSAAHDKATEETLDPAQSRSNPKTDMLLYKTDIQWCLSKLVPLVNSR